MAKSHSVPAIEPLPDQPFVAALPGVPFEFSSPLPLGYRTTGRFIVIFKTEVVDTKAMKAALNKTAGIRNPVVPSDFESKGIDAQTLQSSKALLFERLGIAVVSGEDEAMALAASIATTGSPIRKIEPEYIAFLSPAEEYNLDYLRGFRDGVSYVYDQLIKAKSAGTEVAELTSYTDNNAFTWGLQATKVNTSRYTGKGIKLAVLDTGFDLQHPDFVNKPVNYQVFNDATVQDMHGHGTHCAGTACGPMHPPSGVRRYGIACDAHLYVGKVFNNAPRPEAPTAAVINGIEWALNNECQIASLSLGVPTNFKIDQYEVPIQRALNGGLLVIAAAGNNAERQQMNLGFVESPANADAALAVAAVDRDLNVGDFSPRSNLHLGAGAKINLAAPGIHVFSSVTGGTHAYFDGTSMAAPHVAGIAALFAEATGQSGAGLWNVLLQHTLPLSASTLDVGVGLVQAPL